MAIAQQFILMNASSAKNGSLIFKAGCKFGLLLLLILLCLILGFLLDRESNLVQWTCAS